MSSISVSEKDLTASLGERQGTIAFIISHNVAENEQVGIAVNDRVHCPLVIAHGTTVMTSIYVDEGGLEAPTPTELNVTRLVGGHLKFTAGLGDYYVEFDTGSTGQQELLVLAPMHTEWEQHMLDLTGEATVYQVLGRWAIQMQGPVLRIICSNGRVQRAIVTNEPLESVAA